MAGLFQYAKCAITHCDPELTTCPCNNQFEAGLRAQDPAWGVRDLEDVSALAAAQGLGLQEVVEMPANNLTVVFARTAPAD